MMDRSFQSICALRPSVKAVYFLFVIVEIAGHLFRGIVSDEC